MKSINKKYEYLTPEQRQILEEVIYGAVVKRFQVEKRKNGCHSYIVTLQNIKFHTTMSDEELKKSATLTIDLLEEMKRINNEGMNREKWNHLKKEVSAKHANKEGLLHIIDIYLRFQTSKMAELIGEIDEISRVGGAYAMLISNPILFSAIYGIYDRSVDQFDDDGEYVMGAYFLLRAVMRMNSEELDNTDEEW